jgi:hypothetical protein
VWLEPPDDDVCNVSLAWHIEEGRYGDVDLGGLNVGTLISTEAADDDQRESVEDIYLGRAGGIRAAVADTHVRSADAVTAPIEFSRDGSDFSVRIGDAVETDASGAVGTSSGWRSSRRCSRSNE